MKLPSLRWLVALSLIFILLSWFVQQAHSWLSTALLNIGCGILTAITLVYAYDNIIAHKKESERNAREQRAIIAIAPTIRHHYRVLLDCFRSAYNYPAAPSFHDINEFLGTGYHSIFSKLDLFSPSPANSLGSVPYYQYIEESFSQLDSAIGTMLLNTGRDLQQETYLAADLVRNADFMRVAKSLSALCTSTIPGFGRIPSELVTGMKPQIEAYCIAFAKLVNALEKTVPQGLREYRTEDWHNAIYPPGHAKRT